ncbi:hypothetical protein BC831DRAFT_476325, partial [Entophlyctis helioformis]
LALPLTLDVLHRLYLVRACLLAGTACLTLPIVLDPFIDLLLQFTVWFSILTHTLTMHLIVHRMQRRSQASARLAKHAATSTSRLLIECRHWHSPQPSHSTLASKRHQPILPLDRRNGFTRHCSSAGAALSLLDPAPGVRFALALQLLC